MNFYTTNDVELTSVANAIRSKTGVSGSLEYPQGYIDALLGGGQLPSEYQAVEYIKTDGYAYIDLGASFSGEGKFEFIEFDREQAVNGMYLFGCAENSGQSRCMVTLAPKLFGIYFSTSSSSYSNINIYYTEEFVNSPITVKMIIKAGLCGAVDADNYTGTSNPNAAFVPQTNHLHLFGQNYNGTHRGTNKQKLHGFKWMDGSSYTLIRNMWACYRKADSVIGMYDLANNVFYTNAGSGSFTKGPDIT